MATYWENSCSFGLRYVSWYKYLIVSLVFSYLGFWSGNLFLIAPFPDLCLLVPFFEGDLTMQDHLDKVYRDLVVFVRDELVKKINHRQINAVVGPNNKKRKVTKPWWKKVQVGKDQEKAQSEKDSHSKNRGGKKTN